MKASGRTGGRAVGRLVVVTVFLSVGPSVRPSVAQQCPDGSPPPCRRRAPAAAIDSNALAILPFRVSGPPETQYLREGIADLLAIALDGVGGWRVVNSRAVVKASAQSLNLTDPQEALRIARGVGAGAVVLGSAVAVGSELRLQAELYETTRSRRLASVRARGALAEPAAAADSIGSALARGRAVAQVGVGRRSVNEYTTSSTGALQAYLVAEQHARRAAWQPAADSLLSAIARDSTFGLAWYALWKTAVWGGASLPWETPELARRAMPHVNRLPERQRALLLLVHAREQGLRAEMLRRADELGVRYRDDPDAALEQGDMYFHHGAVVGEPPERALEALERAMRLDSTLPEPQGHAAELRFQMGDTASAWAMVRRLRALAPDYFYARNLEAIMRVALRGEAPSGALAALYGPSEREDPATARFLQHHMLRALRHDPALAVTLADSIAVAASASGAGRSARTSNLLARHVYRLSQGQHDRAWRVLEEAAALAPGDVAILGSTVLHALVSGDHAAEASAAASRLATRDSMPSWAPALAAWWAVAEGDTATLDAGLRRLVRGESQRPAYAQALAEGLRGLAALHTNDSTGARSLLSLAHAVRPLPGPFWEGVQRTDFALSLALARLERAAGDLAMAERRTYEALPSQALPYWAEFEELRGQIAEARGDTAGAVRAYRNFIELWRDADPKLQPRVQAARAALARLEGP